MQPLAFLQLIGRFFGKYLVGLFGKTPLPSPTNFLDDLQVKSISDLPPLPEIEDASIDLVEDDFNLQTG